jgi:hypothetical protein
VTAADAFLDRAEQQIAAPRKARLRASEQRDAALEERTRLLRAWRAWRRERVEELVSGPHGAAAQALRGFLAKMKLGDAAALITAVQAGPWREADPDVRFEVLAMVDRAIVALRERHHLPPFDDALPGEAPTAFEIVREILR